MEPNKLEQDFRNKLEQRTIEPSQMAWDRLDAMLSVTEEKKQPKKRTWMYMAAGFILFMCAGAFLLKSEQDNVGNAVETTVVDAEKPVEAVKAGSTKVHAVEATDEVVTVPVKEEAGAVAIQQDNPAYELKKQRHESPNTHTAAPVISLENVQQAIAINDVPQAIAGETDKLLAASADNNKTSKKRPSVKVDAGSLLSSVEGELDNNFRQDVLQKIVKNYNTVKTSVANRNYEYK